MIERGEEEGGERLPKTWDFSQKTKDFFPKTTDIFPKMRGFPLNEGSQTETWGTIPEVSHVFFVNFLRIVSSTQIGH